MSEISLIPIVLMSLGGMFVLGLLADIVGRHTPLPRVTLLLLACQKVRPTDLSLLASQRFLEIIDMILSIIVSSFVIFEILGSVITRRVLQHVKSIEAIPITEEKTTG